MMKSKRIHNNNLLLLASTFAINIFSSIFLAQVYADDDDPEGDDDGFGKDLCSIAIEFLAFVTLNIIALYISKVLGNC